MAGDDVRVIHKTCKKVDIQSIDNHQLSDIQIGTVDSFQGQETELVVFSAVRSNTMSEIGFLRDPRRLCVALTRARRGLIIVGDGKILKSSRHWEALDKILLGKNTLII